MLQSDQGGDDGDGMMDEMGSLSSLDSDAAAELKALVGNMDGSDGDQSEDSGSDDQGVSSAHPSKAQAKAGKQTSGGQPLKGKGGKAVSQGQASKPKNSGDHKLKAQIASDEDVMDVDDEGSDGGEDGEGDEDDGESLGDDDDDMPAVYLQSSVGNERAHHMDGRFAPASFPALKFPVEFAAGIMTCRIVFYLILLNSPY